MATFKYLILPHQRKEDGTYNVKIRVTQNGKSKYIRTGQFVTDSDISRRKVDGREKIKIKNQAIIDYMEEMILGFRKKLLSAGIQSEQWDVERITEYLTSDTDGFRLDFIAFARKAINKMEKEGRIGTARIYQISLNAFIRFIGGDEIDISLITTTLLRDFEQFLREEPVQKGSRFGGTISMNRPKGKRVLSLYLSQLRTLHNMAKDEYNDEDRGIIRIPYSPFSKYKIVPVPQPQHKTLTIEQMQQIIDLPYRTNRKPLRFHSLNFNLAKDVFLLSFAMMGINCVDIYGATDISDNIITYQRTKTRARREDNAEMKVRIEPEIKRLFDKYRDPSGMRVFVFHQWYSQPETFNAAVNKGLHEIGTMIGVPELHYYYARHTMATLAANKVGIDIARVDEMLNHSDSALKLARVYIERDYSVLWEANRKLLALFDWKKLM